MKKQPTIAQVVAVLELIARFHPAGLGVLLGQVRAPESAEISEILLSFSERSYLGIRIIGGHEIPAAERLIFICETFFEIINAIGGWEHINRMTREVRDEVSDRFWQEAADYATHISPGGKVRDGRGGMGDRLYSTNGHGKYDICERTARRRFRNLMRIIALKILSFPVKGDFDLSSSVLGGYPK